MKYQTPPDNRYQQQGPPILYPRPRRRRRKKNFRWEFLLIPAAIFLVLYLLSGIEIAFEFEDVMDSLKVRGQIRYRQLAVAGLIALAIVAIVKVLRGSREDDS